MNDNKLQTVTHEELQPIVAKIVDTLVIKDEEYGASWKKRGGIGAFMMLARKWDRFEHFAEVQEANLDTYDIFTRALADNRSEGIEADIDDLVGYLLLARVEITKLKAAKRDNF